MLLLYLLCSFTPSLILMEYGTSWIVVLLWILLLFSVSLTSPSRYSSHLRCFRNSLNNCPLVGRYISRKRLIFSHILALLFCRSKWYGHNKHSTSVVVIMLLSSRFSPVTIRTGKSVCYVHNGVWYRQPFWIYYIFLPAFACFLHTRDLIQVIWLFFVKEIIITKQNNLQLQLTC